MLLAPITPAAVEKCYCEHWCTTMVGENALPNLKNTINDCKCRLASDSGEPMFSLDTY